MSDQPKTSWAQTLNKAVAILTALVSAGTAILGFINKLALDANPSASPENISEVSNTMGYGVVGMVGAGAWLGLSWLTPKLWAWGRARFWASSLDPATKMRVRKAVVENAVEALRGAFADDAEAIDRVKWLDQRALDTKYALPLKDSSSPAIVTTSV